MAVVMMVDMMVIVVLVIGKFAHFTPFLILFINLISKWAFEMRKGVKGGKRWILEIVNRLECQAETIIHIIQIQNASILIQELYLYFLYVNWSKVLPRRCY